MKEAQAKEFDIIIMGAGPAGCTAALSLQGAGLRVALLDKSTFPRDKVCGDAIPAQAIRVLREMSPRLLEAFAGYDKQVSTRTTTVVYNSKVLKLYWKVQAYNCCRLHFDNWLLQHVAQTDTVIIEGVKVSEIKNLTDAVILKDSNGNSYKTSLLIGADGAQSIAAKTLANRTIDRDHTIGAVRAYYSGVKGIVSDNTEIYIDKRFLPGYFWVFPLADDMVNVGFGMISSDISKNKIDLKRSLTDFIEMMPGLKERFANARLEDDIRGFSLPLGSRRVNMSGSRYMLAGDAASLIDPISGDGIGNAMASGRLAALHAQQCFKNNNFSAAFMQQYDAAVRAKLGKELKTHYRGQQVLRKMPGLIDVSFSLAQYEPLRKLMHKFF